MTVCSAVWSAATRCIAVTMMSRALSWASSRACRSIARASLTASCSASSRTASRSIALASSPIMPGHALERDDALLVEAAELVALCRAPARARRACGSSLRACRRAGRAARRGRAGDVPGWSSPGASRATSSSASRRRRSFSSLASTMSSFWRVAASAVSRSAFSRACFMAWDDQVDRATNPTRAPTTSAAAPTRTYSIFGSSSRPAASGPEVRSRSFKATDRTRRRKGIRLRPRSGHAVRRSPRRPRRSGRRVAA